MSVEEVETVKRLAQALKPEEKSQLAHYLLGQENEQEQNQSARRNGVVTLFLWIVTLSIVLYTKRPIYVEFPSVNTGQVQTRPSGCAGESFCLQDQSVVDQQLTLMQAENSTQEIIIIITHHFDFIGPFIRSL